MKRWEYQQRHSYIRSPSEMVSPEMWAEIDAARQRTEGSWSGVKTIRVRQADNVMEEQHFTIFEITVKSSEVWGVRLLQRGSYAYSAKTGPFLFWTVEDFIQWFSHEENPAEDVHTYKQLWHKGAWVGHQTALVQLMETFA